MAGEANLKNRIPPRFIACALACLLPLGSAHALTLWQAYQAALENDPNFQSAKYENVAGKEYAAIGRSSLLPAVSASYSFMRNNADITNNVGKFESEEQRKYLGRTTSLNLRQPLFNIESYARYKQGIAQSAASEAAFAGRGHEMMLRVASAYLDVLFATDNVTLATAQRDTYLEQRRVNDRMFQKGEGTRTDMLETQAKLDIAEASLIEVRDNLTAARNTLAGIIGAPVNGVDGLSKEFKPRPLQPATLEDWRELAMRNNPQISLQSHSVEIARQEIYKSRSGHAPRLDFVASYSKNLSDTLATSQQDSVNRTIGVQLNIPIYSGGYVNAVSNQAVAGHAKAKADLAVSTDKVTQELRKQYSLVLSSVGKIEALQKAVDSGRLLIQATQQSIKGGVRINLDLLNARQQFYSSQRDLAQAKYNYLLAYMRLRAAAGVLEPEDMRLIGAYFSDK